MEYPNKKREIFPREAANPAVQQGLNVVARMELEDLMDHFRYRPVLLESVGLDSETVASGNIGLPEAGEVSGDMVLAFVVVDAHLLLLLCAVDSGFGASRSRVKVEKGWVGYGIAHFQPLKSECGWLVSSLVKWIGEGFSFLEQKCSYDTV